MNLLTLPTDLLTYQLIHLPIDTLINLCQTNSRIAKLCNDDYLWQQRVINVFKDRVNDKNSNNTWKAFYFNLLNSHIVPIYYLSITKKLITLQIKIESDSSLKGITDYIMNTLKIYQATLIFSNENKKPLAVTTFNIYSRYLEEIIDQQWRIKTNKIVVTNDISPPQGRSLSEDLSFDPIYLSIYL